jgi:hypothetical protein
MTIRTFQAGDDVAQVSIYNEAAGELPRFKPATLDEVRRRCRSADFDPASRLYAVPEDGRPVGYVTFQPNGRVSYPWCRKGHEAHAGPLFDRALAEMKARGQTRAFAAYRADWPTVAEFFQAQGFRPAREMINYAMDLVDMPTPAARTSSVITPLKPEDVPAVFELGQGVLRQADPAALEAHLFRNPYFPPSALFALRNRPGGPPVAAAIVVAEEGYADPHQIDAMMPCFRLGAFGTEGLTHKRIKGLFSFVAADNRDLASHGLDLLGYATYKVGDTDVETFAAQVPSDAAHLARFYKGLFRRQGAFPIFEREL